MTPRPSDPSEAAIALLAMAAKETLRQRMRSLRAVLSKEVCADHSAAICGHLQALPAFAKAQCIAGYSAYRKEADPERAMQAAELSGKKVVLVRVATDGALTLHRYRQGEALVENAYGIAEPSAAAPLIEASEVDLIVLPALAVDARGHRIGYGQGYYDRLLPNLPQAFKVIIAYDFQLMMEIPVAPLDIAADCVITERRVLLASA